jgi:hemolysin activation/secretion protein
VFLSELKNSFVSRTHFSVFLCGGIALSLNAAAQTGLRAPDAGALQQQIERERPLQPSQRRGLTDSEGTPSPSVAEDETKLMVKSFHFVGNQLIDSERLHHQLGESIGQTLTYAQLQGVAQKVAQIYLDKGWMAYAFLPEQDVTSGVVKVQIIEATMGKIELQVDTKQRISDAHIRQIFNTLQTPGEALRPQALDRAMLLASDLPGIALKGGLREWSSDRSSRDVVLESVAAPLFSGEVSLDNAGSRSTGQERALAILSLSSPMGRGDQATLTALTSQGSNYLRADVSWPVGYAGWRLSLYDAHLNYHLVSPEFLSTRANGASNTMGLSASYPVVRSTDRNLNLNLQAERKVFDNQANGVTESQYKSSAWTTGVSGNWNDAQDGFTTGGVSWVQGLLNLNGSPTQSRDAAGAQTAGRFGKWRYSLSRYQLFSSDLTGVASLTGQIANKNLDSSEKFSLGGDPGVRAYPNGEGVGAQGQLVNLEMRWRVSNASTLVGFYDWGHITLLRDKQSATALNDYSLKGAGISWMEVLPGGGRFKISWARRIGLNPNPSNSGTDQDGSLLKNRLWLSANLPFSF